MRPAVGRWLLAACFAAPLSATAPPTAERCPVGPMLRGTGSLTAPGVLQAGPDVATRWTEIEAMSPLDPGRLRSAAALFSEEGDLGSSLVLAERGLATRPGDRELLWRAASIAISLGDGERAARHAAELGRVLAGDPSGDPDHPAWVESAQRLRREAAHLQEVEGRRSGLLLRAKMVCSLSALVLGAALAWLLRADAAPPRPSATPRQGRR